LLLELKIRDFAVVSRLRVPFAPGLNVLTGETGAGKSILVQAALLLLGERAQTAWIRKGSDAAVVEGIFRVEDEERLEELASMGVELEDGVLVVRRKIERAGRSRAWVNGSPTSVTVLRRLGSVLIDLQGQYQQQELLQPARHLELLDRWGSHDDLLGGVARAVARHRGLLEERRRLEELEREARDRESFVRFQVEELEKLDLRSGELEELEEEARVLKNAHRLHDLIAGVRARVHEGDPSAVDLLAAAGRDLDQAAGLDGRLEEWSRILQSARLDLEECARELERYAGDLEAGAERMEEVLSRLQELRAACRKYGRDPAELIEFLREGKLFLEKASRFDEEREALERNLEASRRSLEDLLPELSRKRKDAAGGLDRKMSRELSRLGFRGAAFRTRIDRERGDEIRLDGKGCRLFPSGVDRVEFLLRPGPGEDALPLGRIASGGELSRVSLALRSILSADRRRRTLIFDEVDSGVGADLGEALGARLEEVAGRTQTVLITHMPPIAARAHHHVKIEKVLHEGRHETRSRVVTGEDRIREVARMLGGAKGSRTRIAHARELLERRPRSLSAAAD
jgi:DNA repair protein RecN (Recombination protein N)